MEADHTNHQAEDEIVMVPVRKKDLEVVYATLGDVAQARTSKLSAQRSGIPNKDELLSVPAEEEDRVTVDGQGPWTQGMVERLEPQITNAAIRDAMILLANRAPRQVTFAEAAKETGTEELKLRAALAVLSKITKRLFGKATWPFSVRYIESGIAVYSMDPQVGKWWMLAIQDHGSVE